MAPTKSATASTDKHTSKATHKAQDNIDNAATKAINAQKRCDKAANAAANPNKRLLAANTRATQEELACLKEEVATLHASLEETKRT